MNCFKSIFTPCNGFSLIEVIATIIVMAILAAFFVHFMGTAQTESWKSVELVAAEAEAEGKLEEIIAYFTSKINDDPDNALDAVKNNDFGSNVVMDWIEFDGGYQTILASGTSTNLKVTITSPGNDLTTILTKSRTRNEDPSVRY
ncbi:MAG: prepilin-type N-terminal cleavage/methylation domain-containing protein [Desulfobacterales bacterium]|nr:MAG: prepilin-type N-terminal cleavage/methylation domain-containing protein [Desulfobacterales bacterium]